MGCFLEYCAFHLLLHTIDLIDPDRVYIHHRLFRDSCLQVQGNFIKDLEVLGRDLTKVPLINVFILFLLLSYNLNALIDCVSR